MSSSIVDPLLVWFGREARDLPWRRTWDPYGIWVAEVMLQQTQVVTVVPYWNRWMDRLPDVQTLAGADSSELLKLWAGLGYYSRAHNLQRAAREIVERYGGIFPQDYSTLLALPGIGRYTAGAICSIAYNQPLPILDGNVIRVITRLFGITADVRLASTRHELWQRAEDLVREAATRRGIDRACSQFNQSLMELGALICAPRHPDCPKCPVASSCSAFLTQRTAAIPNLPPRAPATRRRFVAFVILRDGLVLVRQRPSGVVNGQLWEFPNVEVGLRTRSITRPARACLGFAPKSLHPILTIRHSITRYRILLEVHLGTTPATEAAGHWVEVAQLSQLPFPGAHRRIAVHLTECSRQGPKELLRQ